MIEKASKTKVLTYSLFKLYWICCSVLILSLINMSGLNFILGLQSLETSEPRYIIMIAEFIRAILHSWLLFGVYWKGQNIFDIPSEIKKNYEKYFDSSIIELIFFAGWAVLVAEISYILLGESGKVFNLSIFYLALLIMFIWTGWRIFKELKKRQKDIFLEANLESLTLEANAINKIREKLSSSEQEQLKTLIFEEKLSSNFSLIKTFNIAIWVVLLQLIVEIFQEFIQRF